MTAVTPKAKHHAGLGPLASRVVREDDLGWEQISYPGCHVKTLMLDRDNGHITVLLKMDPGAVLPDHEHTLVEQTYVLEGHLVDKDGPEAGLSVGPGEYVFRPSGSRHSAWSPDGALMIAIFQVPNKFFESNGSVVDMLGHDWGTTWGHVVKQTAAA